MSNTRHEADWLTFPSKIDEHAAWVRWDAAVEPGAYPKHTTLISVRMAYPQSAADEEGLPSPEVLDALGEVEDAAAAAMEQLGAVVAATVTSNLQRVMYAYAAGDRAVVDALRLVATQHPAHAPSAISRSDAPRQMYTSLRPNIWQEQFAKNARVLNALAEHGDDHDKSRAIIHYAYFTTKAGRDEFASMVTSQGFTIDASSMGNAPDTTQALPWAVKFEREDTCDLFELTNTTAELSLAADQRQGQYDGWETTIAPME
ncbi:MAG: DUF695 domain-containing protein [Phycisphaerales bacterium]|nr:DUF695 domain-containing protein [Phycisphaerales bacterium]